MGIALKEQTHNAKRLIVLLKERVTVSQKPRTNSLPNHLVLTRVLSLAQQPPETLLTLKKHGRVFVVNAVGRTLRC